MFWFWSLFGLLHKTSRPSASLHQNEWFPSSRQDLGQLTYTDRLRLEKERLRRMAESLPVAGPQPAPGVCVALSLASEIYIGVIFLPVVERNIESRHSIRFATGKCADLNSEGQASWNMKPRSAALISLSVPGYLRTLNIHREQPHSDVFPRPEKLYYFIGVVCIFFFNRVLCFCRHFTHTKAIESQSSLDRASEYQEPMTASSVGRVF